VQRGFIVLTPVMCNRDNAHKGDVQPGIGRHAFELARYKHCYRFSLDFANIRVAQDDVTGAAHRAVASASTS